MKRLVLFAASIAASLLMAVSCYDDSALNTRLDNLQERIANLGGVGDELASLRVLVQKMENQALVKEVESTSEGWMIMFTDGTSVLLKNADKGEAGDPGSAGPQGDRGPAGEKGGNLSISVKQDGANYYWTVDGEWLLDSDGNKISASESTPQVKIENETLCVSFDGGQTWIKCGVTSTDCDATLFSSFEKKDGTIVITLFDGTILEFPLEGAFAFIMNEEPHSVKVGDVVRVAYTISGAENPKIYCHSEGGFAAYIEKTTDLTGFVVAPATADTETGRVMVFVTNDDNTLIRCFDIEQEPVVVGVKMISDPIVTYASVAMNYTLENVPSSETVSCGICWGEKADPTTSGNSIACVNPRQESIYQAVPAAMLDIDKTYHFRAWFTMNGKTTYSQDYSCKLAAQPEAIVLNWTEEPAAAGLPDGVKVYKTTDNLNGYPFHAWYAIADPAKMELRINLEQGTLKTLETQYAQDAADDKPHVLVNGGYFYQNEGVGRTYINGNAATILYNVTGADSQRYSATRGVIGFDTVGKGYAYWSYANQTFPYPIPCIAGQTPFIEPQTYAWMKAFSWVPQTGISAGPMLIKDSKILPEFTKTSDGYYLNNFEMIAGDIYNGSGSDTDRTAIGYTADGKIILFVCDGRCNESQGADLDQLARILKGLGCTNAMNLDGGGSTAMLVKGTRVNTTVANYSGTSENRPVATNIGFYSLEQIPVVFFGTSVIYWWGQPSRVYEGNTYYFHPAFFSDNNFVNKGVAGDKMTGMLSRHQADVIDLNPKIVVYEGNCNDIASGKSTDYVIDGFRTMAKASIAAGIIPILTTKTPNNWADRSAAVPELNTKFKALAEELGVRIVDIYPLFLDSNGNMDESLFVDGLHPNMAGYQKYEDALLPVINEILGK